MALKLRLRLPRNFQPTSPHLTPSTHDTKTSTLLQPPTTPWSDRLDDTTVSLHSRRPPLTIYHLRNCGPRVSPLSKPVAILKNSRNPRHSAMASQRQSNSQATIAASPFTPHGNPDVTFSLNLITTTKDASFNPTTKRALVENNPIPPSALEPEANNRYPLLTTDCAPFPYIDPKLVTWPDSKEAQLSILRRLPGKMPVVTPKTLSVGLHKALKKKPGPRPPIYHAPTAQMTAPPPQDSTVAGSAGTAAAAAPTASGNMAPPPHASLKRKRDKSGLVN